MLLNTLLGIMIIIMKLIDYIIIKITFPYKITKSNVFNFFNSLLIIKCSVLFETIFLLRSDILLSKFVFVIKFAVNLLSSGVVIYSSCL